MKTLMGWHFSRAGKLLDGRAIKVGDWMSLRKLDWKQAKVRAKESWQPSESLKKIEQCHPVMCVVGYHASQRPRNALRYAYHREIKQLTAERVAIRGRLIEGDDKFVGLERQVTAILSPKETRRMLLLYVCRNCKHELRYHRDSDARSIALTEDGTAKELRRIEEAEAYLLDEASKPKVWKRETYSTALIRTIVEGSRYMSVTDCVQSYNQRSPKGTLSRLLMNAMGL